jgi:hypothetical protein
MGRLEILRRALPSRQPLLDEASPTGFEHGQANDFASPEKPGNPSGSKPSKPSAGRADDPEHPESSRPFRQTCDGHWSQLEFCHAHATPRVALLARGRDVPSGSRREESS